ncbi:5-hydroxytryptamine receptor 3A-like [Huso huso]|uniref:5-hydroxytryptamine receptor 3A-like n=1 Tax=Huso huso TaxID=61971 RepID=A0ABR1A991_HUSHU
MSLAVLLTLAIGCMHCAGVCGAAGEDLVLLGQRLTQGYVKRFRPVLHWDQPVTVYLDLSLYSILDLQEKEEKLTLQLLFGQRWQDEYLSWEPSQFDGLSHFTLPASSVWTPDVTIKEALSEKTSVAVPYVSVTPQGWVRLSQPLVVVLRCSLAMFRFPFDIQKCNITFGPSLHTVDDVKIALERHASAVFNESQSFSSHGEWELLSIQTYSFSETMENRTYSRIAFEVVMGRCPMFYVVNLIVPSALVMLIDLVGFGIPAESGERIPFKVTLLFGYTVFLVLVNDILPPFKHATPVLGIYFVVCLAFLVLSVAESVLLLALVKPHMPNKALPLPRLAALLFPDWNRGGGPETQERGEETPLHREATSEIHTFLSAEKEPWSGGELLDALREVEAEVREVGAEVRLTLERGRTHRACLELMDTLDTLCFCVYLTLMAAFVLAITGLWVWGHEHH